VPKLGHQFFDLSPHQRLGLRLNRMADQSVAATQREGQADTDVGLVTVKLCDGLGVRRRVVDSIRTLAGLELKAGIVRDNVADGDRWHLYSPLPFLELLRIVSIDAQFHACWEQYRKHMTNTDISSCLDGKPSRSNCWPPYLLPEGFGECFAEDVVTPVHVGIDAPAIGCPI